MSNLEERVEILKEIGNNLEKRKEEFISAVIKDIGMTRKYAELEFKYAVLTLKNFKVHIGSLSGKEPVGTVAIMSPYNAPGSALFSIGSAYLTGNTVIAKLSSRTKNTSMFFEQLFKDVEQVNFSYKSGREFIQEALNSEVGVIQLFGHDSLASKFEKDMMLYKKKFIFEGPGKDPFIVLNNADLELAAKDAVRAGVCLNSGQVCMSPERFYIQSKVYDKFVSLLKTEFEKIIVGDPAKPETDVGPIGSPIVIERFKVQLEDAKSKGAKVEIGGDFLNNLIKPTLVLNVNNSMKIMQEETFGPVIAVQKFESVQGLLGILKESKYGLSASIYGSNKELSNALRRTHGVVFENSHFGKSFNPHEKWGGFLNSGWIWETKNGFFIKRHGPRILPIEFTK